MWPLGKNSLTVVKDWGTNNVKETKVNSEVLHQYKLCCICFKLTFVDTFIRFVRGIDSYGHYDIIVQIYSTNTLVDVIPDKLSVDSLEKPTPFPQDEPLSGWIDLYQNCE